MLNETNKLLIAINQHVKQRENQLEMKDEELRMRKKELDDLITEKTNSDPSHQGGKFIVLLKQRENQLEKISQTLAERDKKLEEKDKLLNETSKLLIETSQQVKQRENQLEKKDDELRMRKKELDEVITEKSNYGVEEPPITLTTEIKASFVEKNRTDLIKRITEVLGVIDDLLGKGILRKETYNEIRGEKTREDKVRMLHDIISLKGRKAMSAFYDALQKCDPFLVEDLDGGHR